MKKAVTILLISLMLITSGCAVMTAAAPEPTPAPPTVEELLADALKYYNAGNYEEAILLYEAAIEIEPRNFDATVGLGKAYRSTGNNGQAVETLKAAYELNDSPDVAFELGCAYIANGQYTDAERLASERWKDGEGDNKAGTVLLLSLAAQEKTEEAIEMLNNEKLAEYLKTANIGDCIYAGSYDENGKRAGRGVGLYPGGYIYIGEYKDGVRCGQGAWYYASGDTKWCFTGEWANDAPNGYGERLGENESAILCEKGNYTDGLDNGTMTYEVDTKDGSTDRGLFYYTATNGKVPIIEEDRGRYIYAHNELDNNVRSLSDDNPDPDKKWGISPWDIDAD